jgi:anhydro-N-acetylmuramic acid kinase
MIVAGIMSGTSADGIDVALVRITGSGEYPRIRCLALESFKFPKQLRTHLLAAMEGAPQTTANLAQMHWRLGELYADAVIATMERHPQLHVSLIGCHGQTVYHQGQPMKYLGKPLRCTWQLGEPAVIAARTDLPVVSDFRPADIAVGGQGAPLVPIFDYICFRHARRHRVLQNLGGIGNCTVIPANAAPQQVFAFDTGPGNMLIDACMQQLFSKPYDRNGSVARSGKLLQPVIDHHLREDFFLAPPPKSAGREQYGRHYADSFIAECRRHRARPQDIVATATALTADSIRIACEKFLKPRLTSAPTDFVLSGGGTENSTLLTMLRERLLPLRYKISLSDDFAMPSQSKEAAAFALLAWLTWHQRAGNLPTATGAARPAILGKITHA